MANTETIKAVENLIAYGRTEPRWLKDITNELSSTEQIILEGIQGKKPETFLHYASKVANEAHLPYGSEELQDVIKVIFERLGDAFEKYAKVFYDKAAQSLAEMKCPSFEEDDPEDIFQIFYLLFYDEERFEIFKKQVETLSLGKVRIGKADADWFEFRIKGPAKYLRLFNSDLKVKNQLFVFGPYGTPFKFSSGAC